jgi:hypothetical protein
VNWNPIGDLPFAIRGRLVVQMASEKQNSANRSTSTAATSLPNDEDKESKKVQNYLKRQRIS